MRTVDDFLDEILKHVQPHRGCAIAVTERIPAAADEPNWIVGAGVMGLPALGRYNLKVAEMRKTEPRIDWGGVTERDGDRRRIAKWFPELPKT